MKLFLLRHAEADTTPIDPLRQLTSFGQSQILALVQQLDISEFAKVAAIEHSPFTRACETAELFLNASKLPIPTRPCEYIKPDDDPRWTARKVAESETDRLLVGHNPHFEQLASLLLVQNRAQLQVAFKLSACMALERYSAAAPYGYWQLLWFTAPQQPR
ncbi:MAG: histidine phosphatase family protein [Puniceicoccales bacterium]|jgi:phosphohistidine phosphatase SixA|nr:histidine phosphatase family protein [Puniceicoccales bacterium]